MLRADAAWGIAAVLWISTGLLRAFGGFEKGTAYYLGSVAFLHKMALLGGVLVLELWPMVTFIRWRIALGKGSQPTTGRALPLSWVSVLQAVLIVFMVILATAMARGYWS